MLNGAIVLRKNLFGNLYDGWMVKYSVLQLREILQDNTIADGRLLKSTEGSLKKNPNLNKIYTGQFNYIVKHGAAVIVSKDDLTDWRGAVIVHL